MDNDDDPESDLDAPDSGDVSVAIAVVQSLLRLTGGEAGVFLEAVEPPDETVRWLQGAALPQVNGLLVQTLRRWHECRQGLE